MLAIANNFSDRHYDKGAYLQTDGHAAVGYSTSRTSVLQASLRQSSWKSRDLSSFRVRKPRGVAFK